MKILATILLLWVCISASAWDCEDYAKERQVYWQKKGVETRLCLGYYKDYESLHMWCEYYKRGKWLVDDPATGNKNFPAKDYKTNGKRDYISFREVVENPEVLKEGWEV